MDNSITAWLKSITYDEVSELFKIAAREREAEIVAAGAVRPLTEGEADDLKRIRGYFEIHEGHVHVKAAAAEAEEIAPVPYDYWKRLPMLFPKKSSRKAVMSWATLPSGELVVSTTADYGGKTVTYRGFIPSGVSEKDLPKFGELTNRIYKASIFFQKAQVQKTNNVAWPHVTKAELLKFLKYSDKEISRGGKIFKLIDQAYMTLAFFTFEIKDKRTGQVEEVDHILSWRRDMEGRGFYFKLNDDHTRLIMGLAQGRADAGRYVGLPLWLLREPMPDARRGIFEALVSLGGLVRPYPVLIKTILREWAGMKEADVKKLSEEAKIAPFLSPVLEDAKGRGLIRSWEYERQSTKNRDALSWKIQFYFSAKQKTHAADPDLLAAMLELWGQADLFTDPAEAEKRRKKKRDIFAATIKKHGAAAVRRIFEETKDAEDGENAFWRALGGNREITDTLRK